MGGKTDEVGDGQPEKRDALTAEEAAEWIATLRGIYEEGYLSRDRFEEFRRAIEHASSSRGSELLKLTRAS